MSKKLNEVARLARYFVMILGNVDQSTPVGQGFSHKLYVRTCRTKKPWRRRRDAEIQAEKYPADKKAIVVRVVWRAEDQALIPNPNASMQGLG
jgi:hypothetical protein